MALVLIGALDGKSSNAGLPPAMARLAPDFLVVYGKGAPETERKAAEAVAVALRNDGGPASNLLDDETALADLNRTAFHHLILVGTYDSNVLLRQQWGHWSLDRGAYARDRAVSQDKLKAPFYEGAPAAGFYVFGANSFTKPGTAIIESGRNDLCLVPRALGASPAPAYKISLHLTGVGSEGVVRAAAAFLGTGLLNGVLPAPDEALPEAGDAFLLARDQYSGQLPPWVPQDHLLGFLQPNATDYAGFLEASGQPAYALWRAKYLPGGDITDFADSAQPRSSANELWIAKLASDDAARRAVSGLVETLEHESQKMEFTPAELGGCAVQHAGSFYIGSNGPWLFMETLPEPLNVQILSAALQACRRS